MASAPKTRTTVAGGNDIAGTPSFWCVPCFLPMLYLVLATDAEYTKAKEFFIMSKADAGRKGGKQTAKKYGKGYMQELARKGAAAFHKKYRLAKLGGSDFAIVDRETGIPTGKTIRGLSL